MDMQDQKINQVYDIIIVGLGAMGSASFYHASQMGKKVLGIEQFDLLHQKASYHGETRALRESYFEGSFYIPLVKQSLKMWKELETQSGQTLFVKTGALSIGKETSQLVKDLQVGFEKYDIKYEKLSSEQIKEKFPEFQQFSSEHVGMLETEAGLLFPEKCIENMINLGLKNSSDSKILTNLSVTSFSEIEKGLIKVDLSNNASYYTKKLIISAGMWATDFLSRYSQQFKDTLQIQENTLFWFQSQNDGQFQLDSFPLFFVEQEELKAFIYGFPKVSQKGLVKFALHNSGRIFSSYSELQNSISEQNKDCLQQNKILINKLIDKTFDSQTIKQLEKECNCYYTTTPDHHFIIDYLNENPDIVFLSPCSGHGFKFAIYIGKLAVEMTQQHQIQHQEFTFKRFQQPKYQE
ncbi:hypothetical protein ABPG74_015767 [Tetrahymena malaccensis]